MSYFSCATGVGVDIAILDEIAFGDHACGSYGGHGAWSTALLSRFDEVQGVGGQGLACFKSVRNDLKLLGEDKIQELLTNPCRTLPLPHQERGAISYCVRIELLL